MKQSEPNTLRRELARSQQAGQHPDPDVLTAFTEGALSESERKQLMTHLAACANCRDVLSVAASAAPEPIPDAQHDLSRPLHPPLRTWLPWVATVASVIIVSSMLWLRERKPAPSLTSQNNASATANAIAPPPAQPDKEAQSAIVQPSKSVRNKPAPIASTKAPEALRQEVDTSTLSDNEAKQIEPKAILPAQAAVAGPASAASHPAREGSRALSARPAPAFAYTSNAQQLAAARNVNAVASSWRINNNGQAEHSISDGGWQTVLENEKLKMRVVTVVGNEVWIGGEALHLFHSSDNGTTWNVVSLPGKTSGEHAITHVLFQSPQVGTVDADDGTSWSTLDSGKTWN